MSDFIFGVLLAAAFAMIALGAEQFIHGAGLVAGGVLLAIWSWLIFGEVPDKAKADD